MPAYTHTYTHIVLCNVRWCNSKRCGSLQHTNYNVRHGATQQQHGLYLTWVSTCIHTYIHIYIYVYSHRCVYMCSNFNNAICIHMYMCMYTYIFNLWSNVLYGIYGLSGQLSMPRPSCRSSWNSPDGIYNNINYI